MEAVRALVAATGFFSDEEVAIAAELVQERLEQGAASGYEFVLADRDGRLEGYSCYGLIPCSTVSWDLYWIAVAPSTQGAGLGRRILALTEQRIAEAGGLACYAETSGKAQYAPHPRLLRAHRLRHRGGVRRLLRARRRQARLRQAVW